MSDFAGLWRFDGGQIEEADLHRLADALEGRSLAEPRFWHSGSFGLVHRLAVFTPQDSAERMPFVSESGAVLAADLRLDERPELIRALGLPQEAANWGDSALLARALNDFGAEEALQRVYGEFAFAFWRPKEQLLHLGRCSTGRRSLFVHRGAGLIAFATRLRALLALPGVPLDLDGTAIANHLVLNRGSPERTIYRAIDRVPPGHLATHSPAGGRLAAHWTLPEPGSLRLPACDAEEAARETLDRAVASALRAEGPVTAWLTGGLDTANVAASAARQLAPQRLTVLTRKPAGPTPPGNAQHFYNEAGRAGAMAAMHPNIDWHVTSDEDWGEPDRHRMMLEFAAPTRGKLNLTWFDALYRFMAARGSKVSLGGERGNAFFSYSGLPLLPQLFQSLRWRELFGHLRALRRRGIPARGLAALTLRPFVPFWLMTKRRFGARGAPWAGHSPINPSFAAEIDLPRLVDPREYRIRCGFGHVSAQAERKWCLDPALGDFANVQRARTGADHRFPLASRRVMEYFGALPLNEHLRDGETRSLARRLLRGAAPAEIVESTATGMQNADWFARMSARRGAMREELPRLRASKWASRAIDLDGLQALLDNWPQEAAAAELRSAEFYLKLDHGMEMARFLAWREGSNW